MLGGTHHGAMFSRSHAPAWECIIRSSRPTLWAAALRLVLGTENCIRNFADQKRRLNSRRYVSGGIKLFCEDCGGKVIWKGSY
jgi:hypothetical protein